MIKVNLIVGSGMKTAKEGGWVFGDMVEGLVSRLPEDFDITVSETPDGGDFDVRHYFHSTLAVQNPVELHRSLVTIHALDQLAPHRTFESKSEVLQKARRVSVVCQEYSDLLSIRGIDKNKVSYTPAGIDTEKFCPTDEARMEVGKRLMGGGDGTFLGNFEEDVVRLGVVGRRYPENGRKGEEFLLKILSHLNESWEVHPLYGDRQSKVKRFVIAFVGQRWEEDGYIERVAEAIHPHGCVEYYERGKSIEYEEYPDVYRTLDGILITSISESGPLCLLEALCSGVPVISTPSGLPRTILTTELSHMKTASGIVAYGDVSGFCGSILESVVDFVDFNNEFDREHERSLVVCSDGSSEYSWDAYAKRFESLYREIAAECEGQVFVKDHIPEQLTEALRVHQDRGINKYLNEAYAENLAMLHPYALHGVGVKDFGRVLEGLPAVVVGAGPSLDMHLDTLREVENRVVITACDAALPILLKNDITPHIVVTTDPSDRQVENFSDVDGGEFLTFIATTSHPLTFDEARRSKCKMVWYGIADGNIPLCKFMSKFSGDKGFIEPCSLTNGVAHQVLGFLSCHPITYLGVDLSWPLDLESLYAEGVSEKKVDFMRVNKVVGRPVQVYPDMHGDPVMTEANFINFCSWLNHHLEDEGLRVWNSTGVGILHGERVDQMLFVDWVEAFAKDLTPNPRERLLDAFRLRSQVMLSTQLSPQYSPSTLTEMSFGEDWYRERLKEAGVESITSED